MQISHTRNCIAWVWEETVCTSTYFRLISLCLFALIKDWLIDRRHCQTGWQVEAKSIHEKLREATKSMPNALVEHVNKLPDVECEITVMSSCK